MPIAIDIGTRALHIVQGKATKSGVTIQRALIEPIPSGLVQDGIIREFAGLEVALKNVLTKHRIKDRTCVVTINGSHIYSRELDVPKASEKIMNDVVTFEVQSSMNNQKEVVVEYVQSRPTESDKTDMVHVRASAIQLSYVDDYRRLLKNCKLKPLALDIHGNALRKLLNKNKINERSIAETANILIDMGGVTTTVYIVLKGEIIYSRIVPVGGIDIERYVIRHNEEMSGDQLINLENLDLSLDSLRNDESLANAVRPMVSTVNDGVQRILQFIAGRLQGNSIERVYLYGRTAMYRNLDKTMAATFNLPTEIVTSFTTVKMLDKQAIAPYINAIGALIRFD